MGMKSDNYVSVFHVYWTQTAHRWRTELVRERIATLESKIAQKKRWVETQQSIIRQQIERHVRLGNQLQAH